MKENQMSHVKTDHEKAESVIGNISCVDEIIRTARAFVPVIYQESEDRTKHDIVKDAFLLAEEFHSMSSKFTVDIFVSTVNKEFSPDEDEREEGTPMKA